MGFRHKCLINFLFYINRPHIKNSVPNHNVDSDLLDLYTHPPKQRIRQCLDITALLTWSVQHRNLELQPALQPLGQVREARTSPHQ